MKTILVPTDFSAAAENAALYALSIARVIKANIRLFNAFMVPVETSMASQVSWPLVDYTSMSKSTLAELNILAKKLKEEDQSYSGYDFHPQIECSFDVGNTATLIADMVERENISMIIMGMSGAGGIKRFFLGSTSRDMIDKSPVPLLLIPALSRFRAIDKIAYATNFGPGDSEVVRSVASLAAYFKAGVLIAHITNDKYEGEYKQQIDSFLTDISTRVNYTNIQYRHVKSSSVDQGLAVLTQHPEADIITVVHHTYNWFESLFRHSHTQELAQHTEMPLLVYPSPEKERRMPQF